MLLEYAYKGNDKQCDENLIFESRQIALVFQLLIKTKRIVERSVYRK